MTLFPRWEDAGDDNSDSALSSVNASILNAFIQSAASERTIPIIVYFAQKAEFTEVAPTLPIGKKVLQEAGIAYTDLTPCVMPLTSAERFVDKLSHYTAEGNARVAQCLLKRINEAVSQH
jgi:4-hydroxy-L-threonine phosphate dehydrogenase PdxA